MQNTNRPALKIRDAGRGRVKIEFTAVRARVLARTFTNIRRNAEACFANFITFTSLHFFFFLC